jgi:transcriptional antiterminator Rof (Rho-off)
VKTFDLSTLKKLPGNLPTPWGRGRDKTDLESLTNGTDWPDILLRRDNTYHTFEDATAAKLAADAIRRLPEPDETIHLIVSGRFPSAAILTAVLDLAAPATFEAAQISTLSFSLDNGKLLATLLDEKKIGSLTLLAAEVFAARSPHVFDPVAASLKARGAVVRMARTHCKILNLKLTDGRTFTAEGSANLRSAKSLENLCVSADAALYEWNRKWMEAVTDRQKDRK